MLSYLIRRLSTTTDYAVLRAQLSEAGADILGGGRSRDDLDELLEYALERLGEQLDATNGLLLLLEDGEWRGRAGFGLGVDARQVSARYADVPLAAQALRADAAVSRDFTSGDPSPLAPLAAHVRLERALVRAHELARARGRRARLQPPAGRGRLQRRADRARRGPRPLHRRHRRQRAPHGRARHPPPRPRARPRLEPRLRPEPRHGRGARGGRHPAARRPGHARLRHLRGGRRGRRDAQPRELRRRRVRDRRVAGQASIPSTTSPPAPWPSAAGAP